MLAFLGSKMATLAKGTDSTTTTQENAVVDEIYGVWRRLMEKEGQQQQQQLGGGEEELDEDEVGPTVTRELLEATLVPTLREELNRIDDERERTAAGSDDDDDDDEEKKIESCGGNPLHVRPRRRTMTEEEEPPPPLVTVLLECLLHFVVTRPAKDDKAFFVTSGALEETRRVLKHQLLLMVTSSSNATSNANPNATTPTAKETLLGMEILARLVADSSDALKNDHILACVPLVHQFMEGCLPSKKEEEEEGSPTTSEETMPSSSSGGAAVAEERRRGRLQTYGCQVLRHLSNPLLQELVLAGSVAVLARAMHGYPDVSGVQEHGNAALYNLLPVCPTVGAYLLSRRATPNDNDNDAAAAAVVGSSSENLQQQRRRPQDDPSLLLPASLPSIVVMGMRAHPHNWQVQKYGLLMLRRVCQLDSEQFEWMVSSEGGLSVVLDVLADWTAQARLPATATAADDDNDDSDGECFAQLASQFLKDLSRPSNYGRNHATACCPDGGGCNSVGTSPLGIINSSSSSQQQQQQLHYQMDMVRIIAIKGGLHAMAGVLHKHSSNPNICDPALGCLRNLLVHPETRCQALDPIILSAPPGHGRSGNDDGGVGGRPDEVVWVVPTIHGCMKAQPHDAAINAYACDILGRLAQSHAEARRQIVDDAGGGAGGGAATATAAAAAAGDTPPSLLATILRAMVTHRSHAGVQDRAIILLVALMKGQGDSPPQGGAPAPADIIMSELELAFDALQPKWGDHEMFIEDDLQSFFRACRVPPRAAGWPTELAELVGNYHAQNAAGQGGGGLPTPAAGGKAGPSSLAASQQSPETSPRSILSFSFGSISSSSFHSSSEATKATARPIEREGQQRQTQDPEASNATQGGSFFSPEGWKRKLNFANA